jgi:hypothetical protein
MGPNLRWLFFSKDLPQGKGLSEIFLMLVIAAVANFIGQILIQYLIAAGVAPGEAVKWAWPTVTLVAACILARLGFIFMRGLLIALGLGLNVLGWHDPVENLWQIEVAGGFWLALRVFSMGPG